MGLLFITRAKCTNQYLFFFLPMKKICMNMLIVYWMFYFHCTVLWYLSLDLAKMFIDHVISVHQLHPMFLFYVCGMVFHMNKITTMLCVCEIIFSICQILNQGALRILCEMLRVSLSIDILTFQIEIHRQWWIFNVSWIHGLLYSILTYPLA